jgi:hypothetical protein
MYRITMHCSIQLEHNGKITGVVPLNHVVEEGSDLAPYRQATDL